MVKYLLEVEKYLKKNYQMTHEESMKALEENKYLFKNNYREKINPRLTNCMGNMEKVKNKRVEKKMYQIFTMVKRVLKQNSFCLYIFKIFFFSRA